MAGTTESYYEIAKNASLDASKAAARANSKEVSEKDIQTAVDFINKGLELANKKGMLLDAPDLVSKKEWIAVGANAAFAAARLVATGGTDITAWVQLGVSIGKTVSNLVKIDKALKERTRMYTEISKIYPASMTVCLKKGSFDFSDEFTNCSTENSYNQRFINSIYNKGEQYVKAWQAATFLMYASTVRNEAGREKIMFGWVDVALTSRWNERKYANATIDFYKNRADKKIEVLSNGDLKDPEDFLKMFINPNSFKMNAERLLACSYHSIYLFNDNIFKEKEIVLLNQIYNASFLTLGFEHDWIYKDVCESMLGQVTAGVLDAKSKKSVSNEEQKQNDMQKYLIIALLAFGAYFLWKMTKK